MLARILMYRVHLGLGLVALSAVLGLALLLGWNVPGTPPGAVLIASTPLAGLTDPGTPPTGRGAVPGAADPNQAGLSTPAGRARSAGRATTTPGAAALPAPVASAEPATVTVYVTGAVQHPGVYTAPADARIADLLAAAGGPVAGADLEAINLAARVHDGDQIAFPRRPAPGTPAPPVAASVPAAVPAGGKAASSGKPAVSGPVDLNTADAAALQALPGIGPTLAARIVAYRAAHGRFARVDAIQDVPGIGPKLFARMAPYVTAGP